MRCEGKVSFELGFLYEEISLAKCIFFPNNLKNQDFAHFIVIHISRHEILCQRYCGGSIKKSLCRIITH